MGPLVLRSGEHEIIPPAQEQQLRRQTTPAQNRQLVLRMSMFLFRLDALWTSLSTRCLDGHNKSDHDNVIADSIQLREDLVHHVTKEENEGRLEAASASSPMLRQETTQRLREHSNPINKYCVNAGDSRLRRLAVKKVRVRRAAFIGPWHVNRFVPVDLITMWAHCDA